MKGSQKEKTNLYFHLPFCAKKCGFCHFYSLEKKSEKAIDKYLNYLQKEIVLKKMMWKFPEKIATLYIGGGTPSYLSLEALEKLFHMLYENFKITSNAELTIEVNPSFCDKKKLDLIKKYGVNRISFGIQTADEKILKKIRRVFDEKKAIENIKYAKKIGIEVVNLDFMFHLPEESVVSLRSSLNFIKKMNPDSVYWYETKNITRHMQKINKQEFSYIKTNIFLEEKMKKLGYERLMTEFYSKTGKPCQYTYDFLLSDHIISFGAFAISILGNNFYKNVSDVEQYENFLEKGELPICDSFSMTKKEKAISYLAYILRFGQADIGFINKKFGLRLDRMLASGISFLAENNFIDQKGKKIVLTRKGFLYTPDVQIILFGKHLNVIKKYNLFLGRNYALK